MRLLLLLVFSFPFILVAQESSKGLVLTDDGTGNDGTWRAVIVGINTYPNLSEDKQLSYADRDAIAVYDFFTSRQGGAIDSTNVRLVLNRQATKPRIMQETEWLRKETGPGDVALFYFSGHGDAANTEDSDDGYLLGSMVVGKTDYRQDDAVPVRYLAEVFEDITAKGARVIILTDACRAGKIVDTEEGAQKTNSELLRNWKQTIKIVSCQSSELSWESKEWGGGHGAFTYYLVTGLQGMADGIDIYEEDNKITLQEIGEFVYKNVYLSTKKRQRPQHLGDDETLLAVVDEEMKNLAFQKQQSGELVMLWTGRGDETYEGLIMDPGLRNSLQQFKLMVSKPLNKDTKPAAEKLYKTLQHDTELDADLKKRITDSYIIALQESSQGILNRFLLGISDLPLTKEWKFASENLSDAISLMDDAPKLREVINRRKRFIDAFTILRSEDRTKYSDAEKSLQSLLKDEPDAAYLKAALAKLYLEQNRFAEAEILAKEAILAAPRWEYARKLLADIYQDMRRYKDAIAIYDELLAMFPNSSYGYNNLGNVYYALGRYARARQMYLNALELKPGNIAATYNLGLIAKDEGKLEEAKHQFNLAIQLNPEWERPYRMMGDLYVEFKLNDMEGFYLKSAELEPFFPEPLVDLAYLYRKSGNYAKARELLDKALLLNPNYVWTYNQMGWLLNAEGNKQRAEKTFKAAITQLPLSPEANKNLAAFYKNDKRYSEAEEYYRKAIAIDSFYYVAWSGLAELYEAQRLVKKAEELYREAAERFDENPGMSSGLGDFYFRRANYTEARVAYEQALVIDSAYVKAYANLAFTHLELGNYRGAVSFYKKAIAQNPYQHKPLMMANLLTMYGGNILREKDPARALTALEAALELDGSYRDALYEFSRINYLQGAAEKSSQSMQRLISDSSLTTSSLLKYRKLLGRILLDLNDVSGAMEHFEYVEENSVVPVKLDKALALWMQGKKSEAVSFYNEVQEKNPSELNPVTLKRNYSNKTILIFNELQHTAEE